MKTINRILLKPLQFILLMTIASTSIYLYGEVPENGSLVIKKCQDFNITGDGTSVEWKKTDWVDLTQQGPEKSPYITQSKVLYSETGIYFLFDCVDMKLSSSLTGDFQNIYTEDVVEIFLWTDEKFPLYFEYELSPLNYELPIIIPNFNGKFYGWQPWHYEGERKTSHATSVTGGEKVSNGTVTRWKAEFFIPYKLLVPLNNVPPVSGTKWRANMYRIDYDKGTTHFAWQKIVKSFHEYNNFGTFIFE
jgi:hypothetical protein